MILDGFFEKIIEFSGVAVISREGGGVQGKGLPAKGGACVMDIYSVPFL